MHGQLQGPAISPPVRALVLWGGGWPCCRICPEAEENRKSSPLPLVQLPTPAPSNQNSVSYRTEHKHIIARINHATHITRSTYCYVIRSLVCQRIPNVTTCVVHTLKVYFELSSSSAVCTLNNSVMDEYTCAHEKGRIHSVTNREGNVHCRGHISSNTSVYRM